MSVIDFAEWDATETAAAIRSGAVSALDVVDAAIERSEALNPTLNFLVADDYERTRDRARGSLVDGPFAGFRFSSRTSTIWWGCLPGSTRGRPRACPPPRASRR